VDLVPKLMWCEVWGGIKCVLSSYSSKLSHLIKFLEYEVSYSAHLRIEFINSETDPLSSSLLDYFKFQYMFNRSFIVTTILFLVCREKNMITYPQPKRMLNDARFETAP